MQRGVSARREQQTSFKIVTWTKQPWTKHHNTKIAISFPLNFPICTLVFTFQVLLEVLKSDIWFRSDIIKKKKLFSVHFLSIIFSDSRSAQNSVFLGFPI